ncbi:glycosyltransferase [Microcella alkalica]|uniref:glycosyltransferase n=1 Tax=Microcella alkalica TaxID=355930 RepID=UPI00145FB2A4|nr:glycosyltransferase [Microcella alkalica]
MRVLHVVTLISPDGAYGGPVRVATNQARALDSAGNDVVLIGGARGYGAGDSPAFLGDVDHRLFRSRVAIPGVGFAGYAAPSMLSWIRRHGRDFDVAHIHLARDLTVLPAAMLLQWLGVPTVLQTHGMVDSSTKATARLLDLVATRRTMRRAKRILFLTEAEREDLHAVAGPGLVTDELVNGVPVPHDSGPRDHKRPLEVAFIARLHPRKRAVMFAKSALDLIPRYPEVTFSIAGPDEGSGDEVRRLHVIAGSPTSLQISGALPPEDVSGRLSEVDLYVLPSIDEPFPMSVLEAMSHGKPVIVTRSCGLAPAIEKAAAGMVVGTGQGELTEAIQTFLDSEQLRVQAGANARKLIEAHFSIDAIAASLQAIYRELARITE